MKKLLSILTVFSILVLGMMLTGCTKTPAVPTNVTFEGAVISSGNDTINVSAPELQAGFPQTSTENEFKNVSYTLTATEGDLVTLKLKAVDPDGLPLNYYYSKPFNDKGLWQTADGDAGKYLVRVYAGDQFSNTSADILVVINSRNKPPVINCPDEITVKEGETVNLDCSFFDKEKDPITVEYSGWMTSTTYTTNFESSGKHEVLVRASDNNSSSIKTIIINVDNVPRAPIFNEHLKDMTVTEGDIVTLKPSVSEPDVGENVKITYSEPFDKNGVWKSALGDAGTYPVTVVATSQGLSTKETFTMTVKMLNTAPVMKFIPDITVEEGDTVKIVPDVTDREDENLKVTFSGWMTESTYTTTFDDAYPKGCDKHGCSAKYKVTVNVSDGVLSASQDVYVTVVDKNRPPVFVWPTQ